MSTLDDDAFRTILDFCTGWNRPMTAIERVLFIKGIAEGALSSPGKVINAKAAQAFDLMRQAKVTKDKAERAEFEAQARAVWDA